MRNGEAPARGRPARGVTPAARPPRAPPGAWGQGLGLGRHPGPNEDPPNTPRGSRRLLLFPGPPELTGSRRGRQSTQGRPWGRAGARGPAPPAPRLCVPTPTSAAASLAGLLLSACSARPGAQGARTDSRLLPVGPKQVPLVYPRHTRLRLPCSGEQVRRTGPRRPGLCLRPRLATKRMVVPAAGPCGGAAGSAALRRVASLWGPCRGRAVPPGRLWTRAGRPVPQRCCVCTGSADLPVCLSVHQVDRWQDGAGCDHRRLVVCLLSP